MSFAGVGAQTGSSRKTIATNCVAFGEQRLLVGRVVPAAGPAPLVGPVVPADGLPPIAEPTPLVPPVEPTAGLALLAGSVVLAAGLLLPQSGHLFPGSESMGNVPGDALHVPESTSTANLSLALHPL